MNSNYTSVLDIRERVFTEVAKLAYEGGDYSRIDEIPYNIIPGEVATYRESVFLERAIVEERIRLAIGLPMRSAAEHAPIYQGIEESAISEKYYDPPLINIIKFACNACPEKRVEISNLCQGCLAHPCMQVCPKDAIHMEKGQSVIDQDKCINCGLCINACPYNAVVELERPCAKVCGVDAIGSDQFGRAEVDYHKCVSCGMCLVNCPFGAISDKGQIFQLVHALKEEKEVYAIVAPAFVGQFGPRMTDNKIKKVMKQLGFTDTIEVAIGADLCTLDEAKEYLEKVPGEQPFMATSCCPAWSKMARQEFPELAEYISMTLTPMVLTARLVKREHPDCKIAFIGPCSAKKLEASRKSVRSDVDFVLTFEELTGMTLAKEIVFDEVEPDEEGFSDASALGRGFSVAGGVAKAVVNVINKQEPGREVKVAAAEGLVGCRNMLAMAKAGKYDGYLLEGMACPGGCVGGAGTLSGGAPNYIKKSTNNVNRYAANAEMKNATDSKYKKHLDLLQK